MKSFIALSALAAIAAAAPFQKRDIVWVTETVIATKYLETTETVWVTPGASETAQSPSSTLAPAAKFVAPDAQPEQQNKNNVPHNHMLDAHGPKTTTSTVVTTPSTTQSPTYAPVVDFTPVTTPSATPSTTPSTTPYVAPAPTTPAAPAYTPPASSSIAPVAPPQSSSAPPSYSPPSTGGSGSSSGGNNGCSTDSGTCNDASFTYYTPGVGSCGETNTDSDYIFAYAASSMAAVGGANPNNNPMCGRKIAITAYDGSSITATLTDTCPGCEGGHLDLSPGLWNRVAEGMPGADGVLRDMHFTWLS